MEIDLVVAIVPLYLLHNLKKMRFQA